MSVEPLRRAKHNIEMGKMLWALTMSSTDLINHGCTTCDHEFHLESGACFYADVQYPAYVVEMAKSQRWRHQEVYQGWQPCHFSQLECGFLSMPLARY
jgi:hypothetical protein